MLKKTVLFTITKNGNIKVTCLMKSKTNIGRMDNLTIIWNFLLSEKSAGRAPSLPLSSGIGPVYLPPLSPPSSSSVYLLRECGGQMPRPLPPHQLSLTLPQGREMSAGGEKRKGLIFWGAGRDNRLHSHFVTREGVYCNNLAEGEAREGRSVLGHKNPKLMGVLFPREIIALWPGKEGFLLKQSPSLPLFYEPCHFRT